MENTPAGKSAVRGGARDGAARPVPQCPGARDAPSRPPGQPAANAEAVSPPAVENASGKLLEPNTTTGPTPLSMRRRSGRGSGWRSGSAVSMRASTHEPSRTAWAKSRSCPQVRPRSPVRRAAGRPVSAVGALDQRVAQRLRFLRRSARETARAPARNDCGNRRTPRRQLPWHVPASASDASWNSGSSVAPSAGFTAR